jgi:hypothetical protein
MFSGISTECGLTTIRRAENLTIRRRVMAETEKAILAGGLEAAATPAGGRELSRAIQNERTAPVDR